MSVVTQPAARIPPPDPLRPVGVFSIDVEDFVQREGPLEPRVRSDALPDIDRQMNVVLETLAEFGVRGTFFMLGMLVKRRPDIVSRIRAAGHEIATHGRHHIANFLQSREEFRADVSESIRLLEDITGEPVQGYRAPLFSIIRENLWALDVLAELGLKYDSSIFPMRLPRYGVEGFDPLPALYALPEGGRLVEIPLLTLQRAGRRFPIAGGGYLRLMPLFLLRRVVRWVAEGGQYFTLYMHPYEFDPLPLDKLGHFSPGTSLLWLKRRVLNAKWNLLRRTIVGKIRWMCANMHFTTYSDLAQQVLASGETRPLPAGATDQSLFTGASARGRRPLRGPSETAR